MFDTTCAYIAVCSEGSGMYSLLEWLTLSRFPKTLHACWVHTAEGGGGVQVSELHSVCSLGQTPLSNCSLWKLHLQGFKHHSQIVTALNSSPSDGRDANTAWSYHLLILG